MLIGLRGTAINDDRAVGAVLFQQQRVFGRGHWPTDQVQLPRSASNAGRLDRECY